jgi:hypothetical protein
MGWSSWTFLLELSMSIPMQQAVKLEVGFSESVRSRRHLKRAELRCFALHFERELVYLTKPTDHVVGGHAVATSSRPTSAAIIV